jgi:ABC-type transport system substrate-binding protein
MEGGFMRRARGIVLGVAVALAGCGGPPAPSQAALKTYRHSEDGTPTSLDPAQASNGFAVLLTRNLYDTLYAYRYLARPYQLKPNLAADLPEVSPDGLTYVIRLKPGVRFADDAAFAGGRGRAVVAADVVYSLQRHFHPDSRSQGAWLWRHRILGLDDWQAAGADYARPLAGLRALDDATVQIRLTAPYPQFLHTLATAFAAIVPREAVERYGREFATHPVGSGPFRLQRLDSAQAVLLRNPGFRREPFDLAAEGYDAARDAGLGLEALQGRAPPFVDRVVIDWVSEPGARWTSFVKGSEIQYTVLPADRYDALLATREPVTLKPEYAQRYRLHAAVEDGLGFVALNHRDADLGAGADAERSRRNRALRCAMSQAFDWQARNERFYGGVAQIFAGVLTPSMPEFDPALVPPRRDLAAARALLASGGWNASNLPVIEEAVVGSGYQREMHEQFRGFLLDLGWPAERIRRRSFASFADYHRAFVSGELQVFLRGWALDYPDAQNVLQLFYGPNRPPGENAGQYANAEYDRLYELGAALPPGPERTALYRRMNRLLIDDCAAIFSYSRRRVHLWHRTVTALPDREIGNGFWLRYVDVTPTGDA